MRVFHASFVVLFLASLSLFTCVFGQTQPSLSQLSIAELMDVKVSVASVKAVSQRETPAVVSLITREQIEQSGARDLIEVLRLVPGIDFGNDVEQMVAMTVRGNWSDGKVMLHIDGQEMQELVYGSINLGNRFPIANIERIEIIRGAGSSIYGGTAELAVINIITRDAASLNGISATGIYSQLPTTFGQQTLTLSAGKKIAKEVEVVVHAGVSYANRSDDTLRTIYGQPIPMKGNNGLENYYGNVFIRVKGLQIRSVYDDYHGKFKTVNGDVLSQAYRVYHSMSVNEVKYAFKLNDKLTITPRVIFKYSSPWSLNDPANPVAGDSSYQAINYGTNATRFTAGALLTYNPSESINIVGGVEQYRDNVYFKGLSGEVLTWDSSETLRYVNNAAYVQGVFRNKIANITLGARLDDHNAYGAVLVPRVGLTRIFGKKTHAKLLYNRAYRAPMAQNINLSAFVNPLGQVPNIKPELTDVLELELGYQFTGNIVLNVNLFDIRINKAILYSYIDGLEGYANVGKTGTRGLEAELRVKQPWGNFMINYAFYTAAGLNQVLDFAVPNNKNALMSAPQHKVTAQSTFFLLANKRLTVNPSFTWLGTRYGYTTYDVDIDDVRKEKFSPILLGNIYFLYRNFPLKGLDLGLGSYNILNAAYSFLPAYNTSEGPMPSTGRDIFVKLTYNLSKN